MASSSGALGLQYGHTAGEDLDIIIIMAGQKACAGRGTPAVEMERREPFAFGALFHDSAADESETRGAWLPRTQLQ